METKLGKILNISIGFGGYQEACFGLGVTLGGDGWGVGDFIGTWARKPDKHCKWTVEDQSRYFDEAMRRALALCEEAKVTNVAKLNGVPVQVTFNDDNRLESWRVLTEVV